MIEMLLNFNFELIFLILNPLKNHNIALLLNHSTETHKKPQTAIMFSFLFIIHKRKATALDEKKLLSLYQNSD
jgi:hypothetical protein